MCITREMEITAEVYNLLRNAPRLGAPIDNPEGARYIQISDTLAKHLVAEFDKAWGRSANT